MAPTDVFLKEEAKKSSDKRSKVFVANIVNETVSEVKEFFKVTFTQLFSVINRMKEHTYNINVENEITVKNFPKKITVDNQISFDDVVSGLNEVKMALQKLNPQVNLSVPDSVTVKNFPAPQKLPEYPKIPDEVFVKNLGGIVKEIERLADRMVKKIPSEVKMREGFLSRPRVDVNVDLNPLVAKIEELKTEIKRIPQTKIDDEQIIEELKGVKHSLDTLEFPVPQTVSSWQHSLTMQSEDLAATIVWTTAGGKKVVNYREFTGSVGTYRKTYSYDANGESTGWTAWVKQ